jgi:hypothetical protein
MTSVVHDHEAVFLCAAKPPDYIEVPAISQFDAYSQPTLTGRRATCAASTLREIALFLLPTFLEFIPFLGIQAKHLIIHFF